MDIEELYREFDRQFPSCSTGGFYNPTIEDEDDKRIVFRCYYDGYDNNDDCWHWEYNKAKGEFVS